MNVCMMQCGWYLNLYMNTGIFLCYDCNVIFGNIVFYDCNLAGTFRPGGVGNVMHLVCIYMLHVSDLHS